jgi:hypothetical protein
VTSRTGVRPLGARSYRVGRTLGLTLYAQIGDLPDKSDVLLGLFNTRKLAQLAADSLSGHPPPATRWLALGRLIYLAAGPLMLDDFLATTINPEVAASIVNAVNNG